MPHIHKIHIKDWGRYEQNADAFKQLMYSQTQATLIALENVPPALWPVVRETLFTRLKTPCHIKALSLRNIPWKPEDLDALSNILKPSGTRQQPSRVLEDLDLSQQDWRDLQLMQSLARLLADLPLRGLALGRCFFTTDGVTLLSNAVMRLVRLKTVDFSFTHLCDHSLTILKAHLVAHSTVRVLYLNHCQFRSVAACDTMVEWILASTLRELYLEGNFSENSSRRKQLRQAWNESALKKLACDVADEREAQKHASILRGLTYQQYWGQVRSCVKAMCSSIILGFLLLGTALSVSTILIVGAVVGLAWGLLNLPKKPPPTHPMPFTPVSSDQIENNLIAAISQPVVHFSGKVGVSHAQVQPNLIQVTPYLQNTLS